MHNAGKPDNDQLNVASVNFTKLNLRFMKVKNIFESVLII